MPGGLPLADADAVPGGFALADADAVPGGVALADADSVPGGSISTSVKVVLRTSAMSYVQPGAARLAGISKMLLMLTPVRREQARKKERKK